MKHIHWFSEIGIDDINVVGGKNASLGEMYRHLGSKGVRVPNGFAVSAKSYFYLLEMGGIMNELKGILENVNYRDVNELALCGRRCRTLIRGAPFPEDLSRAILSAYKTLSLEYGDVDTDVAVRSSATAEDLPDASFAGQQETFLNVHGGDEVLEACSKCFASLFTDRAIGYRGERGFDHLKVGLSIAVQKMVRADLACSGVMFTLDTESGYDNVIFITGAYGLGENIVQGAVNPDEFYVFKPTLRSHPCPLIRKDLGSKALRMVYSGGNKSVRNTTVPLEEQRVFCLTEEEVLQLAKWGLDVEDHYSSKAGHLKPMDLEWAKDGRTQQLFIVQARPETVQSRRSRHEVHSWEMIPALKTGVEDAIPLLEGQSVGEKIASGLVCVVRSVKQISQFKAGHVLVTEMTDPDWSPIMQQAAAIVTNSGGRTCHAAIVSRELGIPCIVGTRNATDLLVDGQAITIDCSSGSKGKIWSGTRDFRKVSTRLDELPRTETKVSLIVGQPGFEHSMLPHQGVGLARMEFIIANSIQVHPLACLEYDNSVGLKNETMRRLAELTSAWGGNGREYFVDKLSQGIGTIAAAFWPHQVILRFSDFKTNEYASLLGGALYEPQESNPMLGWRGASRYYSPSYERGFAMECEAVLRVRDKMGLTNLAVMIPFCRTVEECQKVMDTLARCGVRRGENGLKVMVMAEIPSNILLADEFLDICDGFSIGSNDLTQLTLGLDRDAGSLSFIGNELNTAVLILIEMVVKACRKRGKYVGICGQAPSDFPEMCDFLVKHEIESISVSPDRFFKTVLLVANCEAKKKQELNK